MEYAQPSYMVATPIQKIQSVPWDENGLKQKIFETTTQQDL